MVHQDTFRVVQGVELLKFNKISQHGHRQSNDNNDDYDDNDDDDDHHMSVME